MTQLQATGEPIMIPCEGSGCPPAGQYFDPYMALVGGLCSMCGQLVSLNGRGFVQEHKRDDIEARLERGDYG